MALHNNPFYRIAFDLLLAGKWLCRGIGGYDYEAKTDK
jgi:hypothetical protein